MFTEYLLVQRITQDGKLRQFLSSKGKFCWSFSRGKMSTVHNADIFPIEINDEVRFSEVKRGSETYLDFRKKEKTFIFSENYAVLKGFTIVVILPQNYIPISLSFGDKVSIPTGGRKKAGSPGYFDISYNNIEKTAAIVFNIYEDTYFQFSCSGIWANEDYKWRTGCFKSATAAIVKMNAAENTAITIEDVIKVQERFKDDTDLEEISRLLNDLIECVKEISIGNDCTREMMIQKKVGESLNTKLELMSSVVSLADSYLNGGVGHKVAKALLLMIEMYMRG